jgi:hypothetical protein
LRHYEDGRSIKSYGKKADYVPLKAFDWIKILFYIDRSTINSEEVGF